MSLDLNSQGKCLVRINNKNIVILILEIFNSKIQIQILVSYILRKSMSPETFAKEKRIN